MKLISKIYISILLLFVYAPIILLFLCSFTTSTIFGEWTGFSTDLYRNIFYGKIPGLLSTVKSTFILMFAVVLTSLLLGTSAAIGYHYCRSRKLRGAISLTNTLSMVTPDIVLAVALLMLFLVTGITRGAGTVYIAQTALCTPFVFMCILPQMMGMSPEIYEASTDLGASRTRTLFCAILPQLRGSMLSSAAIAASISLNDFAVTLFSRGASGFETLSTYIYADSRKGGLTPEFRALYSIIIFLMLVGLVIYTVRSSKTAK